MPLTQREIATIRAGLIFLSANFYSAQQMREQMHAEFETHEPLSHEEIDSLCRRLERALSGSASD
jgi:cytochrome c-type biogenesis protein CcmH/NrfG